MQLRSFDEHDFSKFNEAIGFYIGEWRIDPQCFEACG